MITFRPNKAVHFLHPGASCLNIAMTMTAAVIVIYPFVQKYFVKGVMIGSVKG
jgi:putative aldouronate transport system permease protein